MGPVGNQTGAGPWTRWYFITRSVFYDLMSMCRLQHTDITLIIMQLNQCKCTVWSSGPAVRGPVVELCAVLPQVTRILKKAEDERTEEEARTLLRHPSAVEQVRGRSVRSGQQRRRREEVSPITSPPSLVTAL